MKSQIQAAIATLTLIGCASTACAGPICETLRQPSESVYPAKDPYAEYSLSKLRKLAKKNDAQALNGLGIRYGLGEGVTRDPIKSLEYYKTAAELGLPVAQANLAYMYLNGEGTAKNSELAFSWAKKSAQMGDMRGLEFVGYMLGSGEGTQRNLTEAAYCYLLSARRENPSAQQVLATLYQDGIGIPVNRVEASLWRSRVRDARTTRIPWQDLTPDPPMPEEWLSPYKLVGTVSSGATLNTDRYSFVAVAPESYAETGWERFSREDEPLVTALRTGLTDYDTYAFAITPRDRLEIGETVAAAAKRLSPQFSFAGVPGRKDCVTTSAGIQERSGTDSLLMVAYCAHGQDVFELRLSWRSLRLRGGLALNDPAVTQMRESMNAMVTSLRFK